MNYILSNHAQEKILKRKISLELLDKVLTNPDQSYEEDGITVFQSIVSILDNQYLMRVFVNCDKDPNVVITVYITNKISKYFGEYNEN
jgi:hypothetical protein